MDVFSKIDLHIHSFSSSITKTGDLDFVKNSTIQNVGTLFNKLEDEHINVCAITDHNYFDLEIYEALKEFENKGNYLKKVLPGIEMDLFINNKIVHTICIFNDEKPDHAETIKKYFETKGKYSLSELGNILSNIGLDVVIIAHQKCDYKGEANDKNSLSSTGIECFYKMIDCEYFDSLEVRSSKVEGILKNRFIEDKIKNQVLISGSDCHDWFSYPKHDSKSKEIPCLLSMKSLPSFRGLVMAITNIKRFAFDPDLNRTPFLEYIDYEIDGVKKQIPLSYGINAIIGDNSVGKSTLIKSLLGKANNDALTFLSRHNIKINKCNLNETDYTLSDQGDIRKKFENTDSKLAIKEEFKKYFKAIDLSRYKESIKNVFNLFCELWEQNELKHINDTNLKQFLQIPTYNKNKLFYISFNSTLQTKSNKYSGITKDLFSRKDSLVEFGKKYGRILDKEDLEKLRDYYRFLEGIYKKYSSLEIHNMFNDLVTNDFISSKEAYIRETDEKKSAEESDYNTYLSKTDSISCLFSDKFIIDNKMVIDPFKNFQDFKINMIDNPQGEYHFITKPIYKELINRQTILKFLNEKINVDVLKATKSEILSNIKTKRFNDKVCSNLDELKNGLLDEFINTYFKTTVELKHNKDNLNESNSAGINALYYLDILSYVYDKKLFIIDQPEDDVSQTKISSTLISSLRNFSKKSQIIMITHNPQLVVNLDADNIIAMKKNDNLDKIEIVSGPLEKYDNCIDMLNIVADTLDGGVDAIKKRWKRYEKRNNDRN